MARKNEQDAVERSQEEAATEQQPADQQEERGEGLTQDEAAGKTQDEGFGGGNEGEADPRYSPGAETINPAYVTKNQDDDGGK